MPLPALPVLCADIGGTNTRLALADGPHLRQGSIRRYANAEAPGLGAVLTAYLRDTGNPALAGLCLAIAGPVQSRQVEMTNLGWLIDADALERGFGLPRVALLNDLQAQGHGLAMLRPGHLRPILQGEAAAEGAPRLVVGVGTGFNAAPVHGIGSGGTLVPASECGHIHLPRAGDIEEGFARHLEQKHGIATVEEALSGRGLVTLDHWLNGKRRKGDAILKAMEAGEAAALRSAQLYARLLGRSLANLALTHLPFGGIYLIGGMARAFAPHLERLGFAASFAEMGRFAPFMSRFGVWSVEDDYAALSGCAAYFLQGQPQ